MSSTYTPTATALTTITLPSDGDARSAASVNAPLEALADGVEYLGLNAHPRVYTFTAAGTITVPAGVTEMRVIARGPGGGGGGGSRGNSTNTDDEETHGGAGGGAGELVDTMLSVTPGDVLTVALGTAGTGGAGSASAEGADGGDATDLTVTSATGPTVVITAKGGTGGGGGDRNITLGSDFGATIGGRSSSVDSPSAYPVRGIPTFSPADAREEYAALAMALSGCGPGSGNSRVSGGLYFSSIGGVYKWPAPNGDFSTDGATGADDGLKRGGDGGTGGGCTEAGLGGAGGAGGAAVAGGSGVAGGNGSDAPANSGAGGGGGGSGGTGTSGGAGGDGGDGATGYVTFRYFGPAAVIT